MLAGRLCEIGKEHVTQPLQTIGMHETVLSSPSRQSVLSDEDNDDLSILARDYCHCQYVVGNHSNWSGLFAMDVLIVLVNNYGHDSVFL